MTGTVVVERKLPSTPVVYLEVGDGPPTVLIHGLNSFAHDWVDVGRALAGRGRQVLIPYRRGRAPSGHSGRQRVALLKSCPIRGWSPLPGQGHLAHVEAPAALAAAIDAAAGLPPS